MKKQAILIMYHNDYYILEKLLQQIDNEKFDIFLHVDKKTKNFNFEYVESWGKNIKTWANKDNMFYGMKNKPSWYEE